MSALSEMPVEDLAPATHPDIIRQIVNRLFWTWFESQKDHKLVRISLLRGLIKKQVYVRDLYDVFTLLFGAPNGLSSANIP